MIKEIILEAIKVVEVISEGKSVVGTPEIAGGEIPTLAIDSVMPISPMLEERFALLGYWVNATHGDWLSISEMKSLLDSGDDNIRLRNIKNNVIAAMENWVNDAGSLFRKERITLFAAEENGFERIYLVWFDDIIEPELWVYDSNGEARYKDLFDYLRAYIEDDLSAYERRWKLAEME